MNRFPVGVIRGVCDYGDGHKSKQWQPYAAAMAASYAKALLTEILPRRLVKKKEEALSAVAKLPERRKTRRLLDSLRFDQMNSRQETIKPAHIDTCKWLLTTREYRDWLYSSNTKEHRGILWIKGKPGTGKSCLMKFAVGDALVRVKEQVVISFFFNRRGEELEKSTTGMYRSLLWQLFRCTPHLQEAPDLSNALEENVRFQDWRLESLQTIFEKAVLHLNPLSLFCFVDGLDECDEDQVRDLISFFDHLGNITNSAGSTFQVYFASRHYPHITVSKGLSLVLEWQGGHDQDIVSYLGSELKIGHGTLANSIRTDVYKRSSGIFMWVVLVVRILQQEYDDGRRHMLRKRLEGIPRDLQDLFRDTLSRDRRNGEELLLSVQWLLFTRQPLNPKQLYLAILTGVDPTASSTYDDDDIDEAEIERFILSSSKGLIEVNRSTSIPLIQFIHESVREFLLDEDQLKEIWPSIKGNLTSRSHERLKDFVVQLLLDNGAEIDAVDNNDITPLHHAAEIGYANVVKLLLDRSATIDAVDKRDQTPLSCALKHVNKVVAGLLVGQCLPNSEVDQKSRAMTFRASTIGYTGIAKMLLDRGARADVKYNTWYRLRNRERGLYVDYHNAQDHKLLRANPARSQAYGIVFTDPNGSIETNVIPDKATVHMVFYDYKNKARSGYMYTRAEVNDREYLFCSMTKTASGQEKKMSITYQRAST
ncbi:hypothetical protein ACHAPU_006371 [Fusarium lateritium]